MVKQKYVIITGVVLGILVLFGGSFFLWHNSHGKKTDAQLTLLKSDDYTLPESNQSAGSGGNGPLANSNSSNSLNVSSSSAASKLGQITPSQLGSNGSSGSSSGSGSSSSASPIDPTTFAQYEKYKDSQSGLFGDVQVGNGAELSEGKKASVYYKGWLTDGKLFDQSRAGSDGKIQPFAFTLGAHQVIVGWEQTLIGMKVGGTRLIIVPPAVGYGAQGQGSIPGNAVLVFQVQLIGVE